MGLYDWILISPYNGTDYIDYILYAGLKPIFKFKILE